jgi:hypothetical protein
MTKYILIICIIIVCVSCKKDPMVNTPNSTNATTTTQDTMLPLAVGNYWIYQSSKDDSIGTYTMQNSFDSLYVEKDSMIMGEHYFKLTHSNYYFVDYFFLGQSFQHVWIKDSIGFLVTSSREIVMNPVNLRDSIYRFADVAGHFCLVPDTFVNRNFVVGQFSGLWMKGYSFALPPFADRTGQHYFNAFAKNIGLLRMRRTFESCPYLCRFSQHLIRYHLN